MRDRAQGALRTVLCGLAIWSLVTACTVSGSSRPESVTSPPNTYVEPSIRQTDAAGRPLPFRTTFPNRWSGNNDGTAYEPCTAVSSATLRRFHLNERTVSDVADSDYQTARGCQWEEIGVRFSGIAQQVGDAPSRDPTLHGYFVEYGVGDRWHEFITIAGRRVLVSSLAADDCETHLMSGTAVVITVASNSYASHPPLWQICDRAKAFTEATIAQIPL